MDFWEAIAEGQDAITVRRVFAEPYERDGIVVIPPAEIRGGGGGGSGDDATRGGSEARGLRPQRAPRPVGA
jgi:hypothetical protein